MPRLYVNFMEKRKDNEQPPVIVQNKWRFHHLGIPTKETKPDEYYLEQLGVYVSGFETSGCGIQWMRFTDDSPVDPLIKNVPHLCFEVDDLEEALTGKNILTPINSPSPGCRVAMIIEEGAPVELIQFSK